MKYRHWIIASDLSPLNYRRWIIATEFSPLNYRLCIIATEWSPRSFATDELRIARSDLSPLEHRHWLNYRHWIIALIYRLWIIALKFRSVYRLWSIGCSSFCIFDISNRSHFNMDITLDLGINHMTTEINTLFRIGYLSLKVWAYVGLCC